MPQSPEPPRVIQILLEGDGGVGKSTLLMRYIFALFCEEYDPTIEQCYRKPVRLLDNDHVLEFIDSAGTVEFAHMRYRDMTIADGIVVVFAVTSRPSFEQVPTIVQAIRTHAIDGNNNVKPFLLVGNKIDCQSDRVVQTEQAQALAESIGAVGYLETSARSAFNVTEAFMSIGLEVVRTFHQTHTSTRASSRKCLLQ
jgi:small GTP-binding protein